MDQEIKRRRFLTATAVVTALSVAGCTAGEEVEDGGQANGGNDGGGLEFIDHGWYEEDFSAGVTGTLRNASDRTLEYVQVEANFYDRDGTKLEDGLDNTTDLPADTRWEFDVIYVGQEPERVEDYELTASTSAT